MSDRQRPQHEDEPIIGANFPPPPGRAPVGDWGDGDDDFTIGGATEPTGRVSTPVYDDEVEWVDEYDEPGADPYDDPYADPFYGDEYYEPEPTRSPLFYIVIALAAVLGGVLVFLIFQLFAGGGDSADPRPEFNLRIDQPRSDERVTVGEDVEVVILASATEQIATIELYVNEELADEQAFVDEPGDGIYTANLEFRPEEPETYYLVGRVISESGHAAETEPVEVIAVEEIDGEPSTMTGEVITNVNARLGPGDDYEAVRTIGSGETVTIVGRNEEGDWLMLDDDTWIRSDAVDLDGDIERLPIREPVEPTPEPEDTPTPEPAETPTPDLANNPDFAPTNASFDEGGSLMHVTISNIGAAPYQGPLVVRVDGMQRGRLEHVYDVDIGASGSTTVTFHLDPPNEVGANIQVIIDPDGAVEEASDDNNRASFVLSAPPQPRPPEPTATPTPQPADTPTPQPAEEPEPTVPSDQ